MNVDGRRRWTSKCFSFKTVNYRNELSNGGEQRKIYANGLNSWSSDRLLTMTCCASSIATGTRWVLADFQLIWCSHFSVVWKVLHHLLCFQSNVECNIDIAFIVCVNVLIHLIQLQVLLCAFGYCPRSVELQPLSGSLLFPLFITSLSLLPSLHTYPSSSAPAVPL